MGVKGLECDANDSPQSSVKVKNEWSYTAPVFLHSMHRDTFNLFLPLLLSPCTVNT
jgi:hypothetical protein